MELEEIMLQCDACSTGWHKERMDSKEMREVSTFAL
jgi:hypothetical protein